MVRFTGELKARFEKAFKANCYDNGGGIYRYPYPLFEILTPLWRIALFAGSALLMTLSTATLKWLYAKVNGYGVSDVKMMKAKPGHVKS